MPRRSSASRASRPAASARKPAPQPGRPTASARKPAPQPVHHHHAPQPAHVHTSERTIGIADGLKFGIGNAIANRFVDAIMGAPRIRHETAPAPTAPVARTAPTAPAAPTAPTAPVAPTAPTIGASAASETTASTMDACSMPIQAFQDCLSSNADEIGKCQFYMDMLVECRKNSASMLT